MEEHSVFDETLPWGSLPYFIQERLYWPAMVHARNEMGWKALHEQLFPKKQCWDCKYDLFFMNPPTNELPFLCDVSGVNDIFCHHCYLSARRKAYRVAYTHHDMFPRTDLPRYKIFVFGYLVENIHVYSLQSYSFVSHFLLTGYHISNGTNGNKLLTRYYDEDNEYTRRRHIFRPIFVWTEFRSSFA